MRRWPTLALTVVIGVCSLAGTSGVGIAAAHAAPVAVTSGPARLQTAKPETANSGKPGNAISANGTGSINDAPAASRVPDGATLLANLNAAAQRGQYEGTFVFQRGAAVHSSRIVHFADARGSYQRVDNLDGEPRWVIEHDDTLLTFVPNAKAVIVDRRRTGQDNFPAMLSADSGRVLESYAVSTAGTDRVAGVDCIVLALTPKDAYRFAYRLSVDPRSGLLIKAQTLDAQGQVLEQVAFSQITLQAPDALTAKGIRDDAARVERGVTQPGWKLVRAPAEHVDLEAAGWHLDTDVPGFKKMLELRRPMAARNAGAPPVPVDQAVFSDGVTAVSLFIEPAGTSDRKPGEGQSGATHLLAQRDGAFWLTLIGEVPSETLRRIAAAIQFHPK